MYLSIPCQIKEHTANQNAGKPLYIRQYSTEPSHIAHTRQKACV